MELVTQIGFVLGICLLGEGVSALLPLPVPAGVTSMLLMFAALCTRRLKPAMLEQTSSFLLKNMALFFIPACVGIIRYADVFLRNALPIVLICVLTTPVVFFAAGTAVRLTLRIMNGKGGGCRV